MKSFSILKRDLNILKLMNSSDLWVYARGYKEKKTNMLTSYCVPAQDRSFTYILSLLNLIPYEGAEGMEKQMRINDQRHRRTTRRK